MSLEDFKNKRAVIKRIKHHEDLPSRRYYYGYMRTVLRLEWENAAMKEVLRAHKIDVNDVFKKYKEGTFLKRLDRCVKEHYKDHYSYDDDSLLSRIKNKLKSED